MNAARTAQIARAADFELEPIPLEAGVDGVLIAQASAAPVIQGEHVVVGGRLIGERGSQVHE